LEYIHGSGNVNGHTNNLTPLKGLKGAKVINPILQHPNAIMNQIAMNNNGGV